MSNFSKFISSISTPVVDGESNSQLTFETIKSKLEELHLKVKWYKDLFIVTYPKKKSVSTSVVDVNNDLVKECRGLIVNKNSPFNVVCKGFDMFEDTVPDTVSFDQLKIMTTIDGTYVRLYYNNDKWCVATNRCIDAKRARWHSYKTFYDYFQEASHSPESLLNYERLNKDRVYLFVVCHPENRIVKVYQNSKLYHIGTLDSKNGWSEVDEDIGIPKPELFNNNDVQSLQSLQEYTKTLDWQNPGFVVQWTNSDGVIKRCKIRNNNYEYVNGLRGDKISMVEHYLTLRSDTENPRTFTEFTKYFPEYSIIEDSINMTSRYVHQMYMEYYVNKTIQYVPDRISWRILGELHTRYIRTKEPTTLDIVHQYIRSMPNQELAKLLRF